MFVSSQKCGGKRRGTRRLSAISDQLSASQLICNSCSNLKADGWQLVPSSSQVPLSTRLFHALIIASGNVTMVTFETIETIFFIYGK